MDVGEKKRAYPIVGGYAFFCVALAERPEKLLFLAENVGGFLSAGDLHHGPDDDDTNDDSPEHANGHR